MEFRDRATQFIRTLQQIAALRGARQEAEVLAQASASLIETGYDNWNNGVTYYTLTLEVPIKLYAQLDDQRDALEKSIQKRMSELTRAESAASITDVVISPTLAREAIDNSSSETEPYEPPPAFWAAGHFRLFVSHVGHIGDARKMAHALKGALSSYHIAAFVAHDDIEPTKEWQAEIESALRTMDALTALVTPEFLSSRWCDQEVGIAIGRGKLVIPLRAGADPHGFLGKYQALTIIKGGAASDAALRVFEILAKNDQSRARMADALIECLRSSGTYERSKKTMSLVERIPSLNRGQVARLVQTIDENSQIKDAYGVPERIKALVSRIGQVDTT